MRSKPYIQDGCPPTEEPPDLPKDEQCEVPQQKTFGEYVQLVLSKLAWEQAWDDPYAMLTPSCDVQGSRLNCLFQSYLDGTSVENAAAKIQEVQVIA